MKPFKHEQTNVILGPTDREGGGVMTNIDGSAIAVGDLPVIVTPWGVCSYWRPTLIERLRVALGFPVRVTLASHRVPPLAVDTARL